MGYIDKDYLENKLEDCYYFYEDDGNYRLSTKFGSNYSYFPSSSESYYVDSFSKIDYEDNEIIEEESSLEKIK